MRIKTTLFVTAFLISFSCSASKYFWVGGSGNWSDFSNHWATTSGGTTFHNQWPQSSDNVFFDVNSFSTSGQTVRIDQTIVQCADMTWTGLPTTTPTLAGDSSQTLRIYGSLTLLTGMAFNFNGQLVMEATTTGKTLYSGGTTINTSLTFNGAGGGWTLMDALKVTRVIYLNNGSLNTNNQTVNASAFYSNSPSIRSLVMGASIFNLKGDINGIWNVNPLGMTLNAGTSTINGTSTIGSDGSFYGGGLSYHNLSFASAAFLYGNNTFHDVAFVSTGYINGNNHFHDVSFFVHAFINGNNTFNNVTMGGNATISSSNTFNNLSFSPWFTYTLQSAQTQTVGNICARGTGALPIRIQASSAGIPAIISKASGTICWDYVRVSDITATGGAVFNAGLAPTNSQDLGGNTGLLFTGGCTAVSCLSTCTPPSITLNPVPSTVCGGSTASFTIAATGTDLSYQWQVNPGAGFTNLTNNSLYSGVTTNTLNITGATTVLNGNQYRCAAVGVCPLVGMSEAATLSVKPSPIVTVNSAAICAGQTAILTASIGSDLMGNVMTGTETYAWSTGATTSSISVSPAISTNYTVIVTRDACSTKTIATVTVNPPPSVTVNSATICAGQTAVLTASIGSIFIPVPPAPVAPAPSTTTFTLIGTTTGITAPPPPSPTTYTWSNGEITSSISVSPLATTSYTVTVTTNGCSNTAIATVIVNPVPIISASVSSSTVTVSATGGTPPYTGTGIFTDLAPGTYTYAVTDGNGCAGSTMVTLAEPASNCVSATPFTAINSCMNNNTLNGSEMWFSFIAGENDIDVSLFDNSATHQISTIEWYEGNCSSLILKGSASVGPEGTISFFANNLTNGNIYFIRVIRSNSCANCTDPLSFDLCLKILQPNICNPTPTPCNLIQNPGFESGPTPAMFGGIRDNYAFCWTPCGPNVHDNTPDLMDVAANTSPQSLGYGNCTESTGGVGIPYNYYSNNEVNNRTTGSNRYACMYATEGISGTLSPSPINTAYYIEFWTATSHCYGGAFAATTTFSLGSGTTMLIPGSGTTPIVPGEWSKNSFCIDLTSEDVSDMSSFCLTHNSPPTENRRYFFDDFKMEQLANAGPDKSYCKGGAPVMIGPVCPSSAPNATYSWNPSTGLSCTTCPNPMASPASTTNYTLTVTSSASECIGEDVVEVKVNPLPNSFQVIGSTSSCSGSNYTVSPSEPDLHYTWTTPGSWGIGSTALAGTGMGFVNFNPTGGTITFTATSSVTGCSSSSSLYVGSCCNPPSNDIPNQVNSNASALVNYGTTTGGVLTIPNKQFSINGIFHVNKNLKLEGCTVTMGYLAKIIVDPGFTLTITDKPDKSHLYACNEMWDGIYLPASSSKLIINNGTTIEDALNAVVSNNKGLFLISSTPAMGNVIFNKNLKSIVVNNPLSYLGTHSGLLSSTTIQCYDGVPNGNPANTNGKLHYPHATKRSDVGVEITSIFDITIGNPSNVALVNTFDNLDNGIRTYNSSVNVYNNNFKKITYTALPNGECFPGIAICATGLNYNNRTLKVGSNLGSSAYRNTFFNCYRGVAATTYMNVAVWNNTFTNIVNTAVRMAANYNKRTLTVNKNTINYANIGIDSYDNRGSYITINDNVIADGLFASNEQGIRAGEIVKSYSPTTVYNILNNVISNVRWGINASGLSASFINTNIVNIKHAGGQPCYGIRLTGSTSSNVVGNVVKGQNKIDNWVNGIYLDLCDVSTVSCNTSDKLYTGLFFGGVLGATSTSIKKNLMNNNFRGLMLSSAAVGIQGAVGSPNDNRWTNITAGNYHTYSLNSIGANSKFYVRQNTGGTGTPYNPVPYFKFASPALSAYYIQLVPTTGNLNSMVCPVIHSTGGGGGGGAGSPKAMALQIAGDSILPTVNIASTKWMLKQGLYNYLQTDSSLVSTEPLVAQFKAYHSQNNLGKLEAAEKILGDPLTYNASALQTAQTLNNTVSPSSDAETNSQWMNNLLIDNALSSIDYTVAQLTDLRVLASKCPYNDGIAVFQARTILSQHDTVDYINECEMELHDNQRSMTIQQAQDTINTAFKLYPNPNNGTMQLDYSLNPTDKGDITIFDIAGKLIYKYDLDASASQIIISHEEFNNGIYFYKIIVNSKVVQSDKLIIIK